MAFYTDSIDSTPRTSLLARIGQSFGRIASALVAAREVSLNMEGRVDQMDALNAKSDAELAAMGLKRDEITRYVFRDLYYI